MKSTSDTAGLRIVVTTGVILFTAMVVLTGLSQLLPSTIESQYFDESGPFEQVTPWLWILLCLTILTAFRVLSLPVLAAVILSLACAAREWDMHKAFTGYSVLKPGFYLSSEHALHHQLIAGPLVLLVMLSCVILIRLLWIQRPRRGRPLPPWTLALLIACGLMVFTKILDRSPNIIQKDLEFSLPEWLLSLSKVWEEGLEVFLPVAFGALVLTLASNPPSRRPAFAATQNMAYKTKAPAPIAHT